MASPNKGCISVFWIVPMLRVRPIVPQFGVYRWNDASTYSLSASTPGLLLLALILDSWLRYLFSIWPRFWVRKIQFVVLTASSMTICPLTCLEWFYFCISLFSRKFVSHKLMHRQRKLMVYMRNIFLGFARIVNCTHVLLDGSIWGLHLTKKAWDITIIGFHNFHWLLPM